MALTEKDVADIASYTRIALTPEKLAAMTADLNAIVETLAPIKEFDLSGVKPTFHPIGDLSNVMREDTEKPSLPRDVALENSDSTDDGCFLVPTILGGGDA